MLGYPHIAFDEAVYELGHKLVEHITAQDFIVVPVEEFLRDHRDAKSDLWGQLVQQGVGAAIENVPSPLHRLVLSRWNPKPGNLFAAHRTPKKLPSLTGTEREALETMLGINAQIHLGHAEQCGTSQHSIQKSDACERAPL